MRWLAREVGFAVMAWLLPLVAAISMSGLRDSRRDWFESLMAVALAGSTVLLACLYLRGTSRGYLARGLRIGLEWMAANWILDSLMFSRGPMQMTFSQYMMDIGTTYLMIPIITVGLGIAGEIGAAGAPADEI